MWKYLTEDKYEELLSSFNLINSKDIKKTNKILYGILNDIDNNYEEIIIHKKNGKLRFLYEPSEILKKVQKNILNNVLEERILSDVAFAYRKGYSLKDNAKFHINKKIILKLDIKNFFDNITFNKVYDKVFNEELYPKKLGLLLTNLCVYNNKLPQGVPTSGYISNLVLRDFDEEIKKYCCCNDISYTRYSDDMTFSGDFDVNNLIKVVRKLLFKNGFKLNKDKIKVIRQSLRQQVTGVIVNKKLSIKKSYKRKIRQEFYYIKKYGIDNHIKRINVKDKNSYLKNLIGRINFVINIEQDNKEFKFYNNYLKKKKMNEKDK